MKVTIVEMSVIVNVSGHNAIPQDTNVTLRFNGNEWLQQLQIDETEHLHDMVASKIIDIHGDDIN